MLSSVLRILAFLWSLIGSIHCMVVTVPVPVVNVTAGNSATLYCNYQSSEANTRNLLIQWSVIDAFSHTSIPHSPCSSLKEGSVNQCTKMAFGRDARGKCSWRHQVYFMQNGQPFTEGRYKNRVTASNVTRNATISISNMQPQDTGFYTCEVSNLPDSVAQAQVQVIVLVPPSTPLCSIDGNIASGHPFKLMCHSKVGFPLPTYTWTRILHGVTKPLNLEQENGVLTIGNMTKFEDGYYQCTASNSLGNATCQVDLHTGGEAGIIVGGIIGAVLLAAIIIAIIWFLIAKEKNKKHVTHKEMKTISSSAAQAQAEEPARQNLVVSEPPETKEYRDHPENAAATNGEVEDPAV